MIEMMLSGKKQSRDPTELIGYWENPTFPPYHTGFYGEVPSDAFITASDLSAKMGMSLYGALVPGADEQPWLKFLIDGTIVYIAKRVIRSYVSRSQLDIAKVVDGSKQIAINGHMYKVRLIKMQSAPSVTYDGGDDPVVLQRSEWNRLIFNVWNNDGGATPPSQEGGKWGVGYSSSEFTIPGIGIMSGETCKVGANTYYTYKDGTSVRWVSKMNGAAYTTPNGVGWMPLLERVS